MVELPNYSSQLLQQLWSLRKEGHYCDCTIMVGESQHHAHKVVLAASSMLFRSLLDGSDTISIDTAVVSPQEFACLLDMVYTGKLPLGKHSVSRVVAAADSLQMFDVAVGFKNVLASLVTQKPPVTVPSLQTPTLTTLNKDQSETSDTPALSCKEHLASERVETKTELQKEDRDGCEEPACKKVCVESSEAPESEEVQHCEGAAGEDHTAAAADDDDEASSSPAGGLLKPSSQLVELLTNMPSVVEQLSQAAVSSLEEAESWVVRQCCEECDSASVLERLMSRVQEGLIGEGALLKLLQAVQQQVPSPAAPPLEEAERSPQQPLTAPTAVSADQQNGNMAEGEQVKEVNHVDCKEEAKQDEREAHSETDLSSPPASPSKPYTCHWCKKSFDYKCRLVAHTKRCSMSQEGEQQCPHCPKKLCNQRALQRHRAEAHHNSSRAKKKVSCDLCGRSFAHPSGMIYHKRTEHFDEKPFACEECGVKFGANSSLKNHMRLHTGEKPYQCKHCDMSFSVAAALAYHTKKKHSEGKMYVCQYCKAVFAQSIELTRHVRTHTGDRPYVCRHCGKGYSQASGLTVHLQTFHNLSEPQDCQKCCLSFTTLEEHRQHIEEFHSKEFHKCTTCNKVFPRASLLDKHKGTHNGTKPFSCDHCNKSYQQLSGLWYHNRTNHPDVFASHTRQLKTLVQCDVCFKFFPSAASLSKHRASEHPGCEAAAGRCPYCPLVLGGTQEVQEHISTQHGSQGDQGLGCPLCSALCTSQLELQEHLLACHVETQQEQESEQEEHASTSFTVISAEGGGAEPQAVILPEEQSQPGAAQHLLVALSGGTEGQAAAELVEVNMYDLLNSSVTFICEDKSAATGALT